jgi:hypothetical protein
MWRERMWRGRGGGYIFNRHLVRECSKLHETKERTEGVEEEGWRGGGGGGRGIILANEKGDFIRRKKIGWLA